MGVSFSRFLLTALLALGSLAWLPFAAARLLPLDGLWTVTAIQAFALYAAVVVALALAAAVAAGKWVSAALALVGLAVLVPSARERGTADRQPSADGRTIVVATSNVRYGLADQRELMALLRRERVDVIALQENTVTSDRLLRAAGLRRQFPVVRSAPDRDRGAGGLALASRWPITVREPAEGDHRSLGGVLQLPGGQRLAVRSVHPPPPFNTQNLDCWRSCTRALASTRTHASLSILAGDFNATLDHRPLRDLLGAGYRDAAEQVGHGLRSTWHRGHLRLTIDHVLVSRGIAVREVTVHRLPGSDHDVVIARLTLPRTPSTDA